MPAGFGRSFRFSAGALASVLTFTTIAPANVSLVAPAFAQAGQAQEQIDFDAALEGYGHWVEHPKLGDVWIPDSVPQDWQPYRIGHWVYTDDWGWYWNSDEDFGWVTYHYGRWYLDPQLGWVWIPGDEWGPAWVNWRQGDNFVGWAPTPPDEYLDDEEAADNYMFVEAGNLLAPEVYTVFIPYRERRDYYHRSRLVNRTIIFADRRGAVNPGIPPAFIAHASGRPFHYSHVAPIVLAGTIGVAGAVILRNHYRDRARTRIVVRRTDRIVRPSDKFERLQALNKGERGRLWNKDLRAAQGGRAILSTKTQPDWQKGRYIRTKGDAQRIEQKKIEQRKIETKRIEERNIQPRNLQQQKTQQKNFEQKANTERRDRRENADRKDLRWNDTQKKNVERRDIQQKNLQQKNLQQNNQQKNFGSSNRMQQNNSQHHQQNTQRQNVQQHSAPRPQPQRTQRPQQNKKANEKTN
ncbi:MAG TPA: DUF6600 domain-containing protein [Xanthobacteraceae bacterium]|nr:DUF6600 domain-containing protein [Xanthobacteraceae bacterium]